LTSWIERRDAWAAVRASDALDLIANASNYVVAAPSSGNRYAFVFGNEVNGLSDDVLELLDVGIEIPQFGTKHSFNVSVTAGIVLWDFFSKR